VPPKREFDSSPSTRWSVAKPPWRFQPRCWTRLRSGTLHPSSPSWYLRDARGRGCTANRLCECRLRLGVRVVDDTGDDEEILQSNARSCYGGAVDTLFFTYHLSDLRCRLHPRLQRTCARGNMSCSSSCLLTFWHFELYTVSVLPPFSLRHMVLCGCLWWRPHFRPTQAPTVATTGQRGAHVASRSGVWGIHCSAFCH